MSQLKVLLQSSKTLTKSLNKSPIIVCRAWYAAGLKGKLMATPQKKKLMDVETDANKLCNYVCGANYYKEGEDPSILPDSEYPEWLFNIRLERNPPDLSELNKEDSYYWYRLRLINLKRQNKDRKYANLKSRKRIW